MIVPKISALAILAAIYWVSFVFQVDGGVYNASLCPLLYATGIFCPLCGMTRGFIDISHGRFSMAICDNPASTAVYLLGAVLFIYLAVDLFIPKLDVFKKTRVLPAITTAVLAAVFIVWAVRIYQRFS